MDELSENTPCYLLKSLKRKLVESCGDHIVYLTPRLTKSCLLQDVCQVRNYGSVIIVFDCYDDEMLIKSSEHVRRSALKNSALNIETSEHICTQMNVFSRIPATKKN